MLRIDVFARENPDLPETAFVYDRNWLTVRLSAEDSAGRISISGAYLLTFELCSLLQDVRSLIAGASTELEFRATEPVLDLTIRAVENLGHLEFRIRLHREFCRADRSMSTHEYQFEIDRTDLQILERQLCGVLEAFPVIGEP